MADFDEAGPVGDVDEFEEEEDRDNAAIFEADGTMRPDHPLLARAQEALRVQLETERKRLEDAVREKTKALKDAKRKREDIGVELYTFQQQLAKLQMQLEKAHDNMQGINNQRLDVEEQLMQLKSKADEETATTGNDRKKVNEFENELDKRTQLLKQIEEYNASVKDDIATTRRATYAAEEAVQKLEKEKQGQDLLIDNMQETLKRLHQQHALYMEQLDAQKRETRAARETLAEAETEIEGIHFEKKQLTQQWRSSLMAVQRRDEALQELHQSMQQQEEQSISIENEMGVFKRDIRAEQLKNEQLTAVLKKVEGEAEFVSKQIVQAKEKAQKAQGKYTKLSKALQVTVEKQQRLEMEHKILQDECNSADKAFVQVTGDAKAVENQMLATLSDQTTVEKSAQKTVQDTRKLRSEATDEETKLIQLQNELARLEVDILNTDSHNEQLHDTLKLLDEELREKSRTIERYELEIQRRTEEIEKKTRDVDVLNRRYETLVANMETEDTGPLEATINNLNREIQRKGVEGKELQRRWIRFQTELAALQQDNNVLDETLTRMKSEHTVLTQKRMRQEAQYELQLREVKGLEVAMQRLHQDLSRLNNLIAKNSELSAALEDETFNIQSEVMAELRGQEEEAVRLESVIASTREEKKEVMQQILETEKQVMLWERKIQLEKEMQEMLDPTVGQDVVAAMKREIHRMQLRHGELERLQEKLMQELERAVGKREMIAVKGRASAAKSGELTETQLQKAVQELNKSIRDTKKEATSTDRRIAEHDEQRTQLAEEISQAAEGLRELRSQEQQHAAAIDEAQSGKTHLLLVTTRMQRMAQRFKGMEQKQLPAAAGSDEAQSKLDTDTEKAKARLQRVESVILALQEIHPQLQPQLQRILMHSKAAA